jgi:hypothetical protein
MDAASTAGGGHDTEACSRKGSALAFRTAVFLSLLLTGAPSA